MSAKPLTNRRVVITRSAEQAVETKALLEALGAEAILFPAITFIALDSPELKRVRPHLADYDWVIFSSANAVRFFAENLGQGQVSRRTNGPKVAAVGAATAQLLEARGVRVDFIPDKFTGEALARGLGDVRGRRVLLPRSRKGRPEIIEILRRRGAQVDDIPLYDAAPPSPDPAALARLASGFDAIIFASPSAVHHFLDITKPEPLIQKITRDAVIACIGPTTARACRAVGLPVHVVPTRHTMPHLVQALAAYFTAVSAE
ncbi:MAG: uroporphyrinogen-III synthase [Chloroflexi bacterium]|nr:uroporphyrinogen-III synthase [Chloroflexota bacterium]